MKKYLTRVATKIIEGATKVLHNKRKTQSAITLVALVITIVILLVLATVSINLAMNGGIIDKSKIAVDKYSEEEIGEQIKLTYLEYEIEKLYKTNTDVKDFMEESLEKIYGIGNVTVTPKNTTELFPMIVSINGISYDLLSNGTTEKRADYATLESLYGKVVNGYTGYSATDVTEWKLLYVDEENRDALIISSNVLEPPQPTAKGIPFVSRGGVEYIGSNDVASFEFGKNYNGLWLDICTTNVETGTSIATAYLCDPNNWSDYVTGKAKYAAGGPTIEIIMGSFFEKSINNISDKFNTINSTGYQKKNVLSPNMQLSDIKKELYYTNGKYWVASPNGSHDGRALYFDKDYSLLINANLTPSAKNIGLRPIVCLPVSAIQINGEGDNITLEYK